MRQAEKKRECPVCFREYPADVEFCAEDGHALPVCQTMFGHQHVGSDTEQELPDITLAPERENVAEGDFQSAVMEAGTQLGSYRLVKLIGRGGMGEVYLALHLKLGRKVALKLLRSTYATNLDAVRRFFREAQAASQVNHPNIVAITDFVENEAGSCFYVMEYLQGESLYLRKERKSIPLSEVLEIGEQMASGLDALHGAGIVHRDLKPANVFLAKVEGQPLQVKLLDFGLIKLRSGATLSETEETPFGGETLIGTPQYMSPEQVKADSSLDHRADIYAFGVILYELVVGKRPIDARAVGELLVNIVTEPPKAPSTVGIAHLPKAFEQLIMRCLEKDPSKRPQSARKLIAELHELREPRVEPGVQPSSPSSPSPSPLLRSPPAFRPRRRKPWALVASLAVLLAAALVVSLFAFRNPPPVRKDAPIALLQQAWQKVERRARDGSEWLGAKEKMKLYHLDALKTGKGAGAEVSFHAGGLLQVDEKSVVLIEAPDPSAPDKTPLVHLRKGTIRGVAKPGQPLHFITAEGKMGRIVARGKKAATFRLVTRRDGSVGVAVLQGQMQVGSEGKITNLDSGQVVDMVRGEVGVPEKLPPFPQLVSPGVDALVPADQVTLWWRAVPRAKTYRVQLAKDLGFRQVLIDRLAKGVKLPVKELKRGRYTWRVRTIGEHGREGEFGFARRMLVLDPNPLNETESDKVPLLTKASPKHNTVIQVTGKARVAFRFEGGTPPFLLVVARQPSLAHAIVLKRRLRAANTQVGGLKPGIYYWAVYAPKKDGGKQLLLASIRRLIVRKKQAPQLHLPEIDWKAK
ncbi:MAG: protein kinase [Deltaproteobacteria bacterium]|nr:protein kinase [Deltaproteobacteria bacterium]